MKTLSVKLPELLFAEIVQAAQMRRVPKSTIVRERLERVATTTPGESAASLWSRMEDLVLDDEALPADLSSNKEHLQNYGRNRAH